MSDLFKTGVRPKIDEYIDVKRKQVRDYGDYWSASSAGYCMRKNIFERLGVPHSTEDEARLQRVFESGHIFHQWVQGITKDAGISVAQEVELQDEDLMVRGHFDDLVLVEEKPQHLVQVIDPNTADKPTDLPKHLILYDYKTVSSMSFKYSVGRPMSHFHRLQLGTYMFMARKDKYPELDEGRILKISKDDLRMAEDQLIWTEGLEKDVVQYWNTLNGYWKNKKLPKCTCADFEGGFMARERYNPFFYDGEPCSLAWFAKEGVDGWS